MKPRALRLLILGCSGLLAALACSSKSSSSSHARDASADGQACGAPLGPDNLSFDVACTAGCSASRHVTFDITPGDHEGALCREGGGHLQLNDLVGDDQSVFGLDIDPGYTGEGDYATLGAMGDLLYSNVAATCSGVGTGPVPIILSLPDPTDPKGSCTVTVTQDCATTTTHAISGTFTCSLPIADRGASCTIKNGTFSFQHCE